MFLFMFFLFGVGMWDDDKVLELVTYLPIYYSDLTSYLHKLPTYLSRLLTY